MFNSAFSQASAASACGVLLIIDIENLAPDAKTPERTSSSHAANLDRSSRYLPGRGVADLRNVGIDIDFVMQIRSASCNCFSKINLRFDVGANEK